MCHCQCDCLVVAKRNCSLTVVVLAVQENSRLRRERGPCGDHTYQAAKALDFDSASNASFSTFTNGTASDENSNSATTTISALTGEEDSFFGPTTRRQWSEWVNNRPPSGSESQNENESSVGAFSWKKVILTFVLTFDFIYVFFPSYLFKGEWYAAFWSICNSFVAKVSFSLLRSRDRPPRILNLGKADLLSAKT